MLGGSEDVYPAGAVLNNGKDVDFVPLSRSAVNKSNARIPYAWDRRNSARQVQQRHGTGNDQEGER